LAAIHTGLFCRIRLKFARRTQFAMLNRSAGNIA
jgi:hypothetical protein